MVKESSQKDKQTHIKTKKKRTLKRKSSRKELKRTKKRKHDEEGGGFFDMFRTVKISGTSKDDDFLEFEGIWDLSSKPIFEDLKSDFNSVEIIPAYNFNFRIFWKHFSRIYGLTDNWNNLVSKSRLRYLLEFKFFRKFMGGDFDYKGIITSDDVSNGLRKMRGHIGTFLKEYLTERQLLTLLEKNIPLQKGVNGIFGWVGGFGSHSRLITDIWGVQVSEILKDKKNYERIAKILIDEDKDSKFKEREYIRFKKLTFLLIYVYHFYEVVRIKAKGSENIAKVNPKKKKTSSSTDVVETKDSKEAESDITQLNRGMEKLLQTGVFKKELLDNANFRIFFMSYMETMNIRSGIWINYSPTDGEPINLYLLTNNIKSFRFLDCLYTDEYEIDALTLKGGINLDSNKFVAGHDCPTELSPEVGTKINKDYFAKLQKDKKSVNIRGISFYPMRCPNRGFKQLVSECRQIAFVNHIISENQNTINNLPHNMFEFHNIIPNMFKKYEDLTLENFKKFGYTKIKLIELPEKIKEANTAEDINKIYSALIKTLKKEFKNLRVTVNNGEKSVKGWGGRIAKVTTTSQTDDMNYMELGSGSRMTALKKMYEYFTQVNDDANPKVIPIDNLHTTDDVGNDNAPIGYETGSSDDVWIPYSVETPDFESQLIAYCTNATDRTWMSWVWGASSPVDKARPYVRTLLSLIHMKDYDEKLFDKPDHVSKLKTLGHKLSEISQKYFLPHSEAEIKKENYMDDMNKLKDLFYDLGKKTGTPASAAGATAVPPVGVFDPTEITFNFKPPVSSSGTEEKFLTIEDLKEKIITNFKYLEVKVGIALKETGGSSGDPKKYYTQQLHLSGPIPTKSDSLNTFIINSQRKVFFKTDMIPDSEELDLDTMGTDVDTDEDTTLKVKLKEKLSALYNADTFIQSRKYQMFIFLYEDNKVKEKKTSSPSATIKEEPQMSFWFKEES